MARTSSSSDDKGEGTEQGDKPAATDTKAPARRGATGQVLYALHRGGPYNAVRNEGSDGPMPLERVNQTVMRLLPGLNLIDRKLHNELANGKGLGRRIDAGEVERLAGFKDQEWPDDWHSIKAGKCIELVEGTSRLDVLQRIHEIEQREEVLNAVAEQIDACRGKSDTQQKTRAAKRQFNRRGVSVSGRR